MKRVILKCWFAMFFILITGVAYGARPCVVPSMRELLSVYAKQNSGEDFYPDATSAGPVITQIDNKTVQWYGIQWESPPNGLLFVLSCEGKVLIRKTLGAVDSIEPGPRLPGAGNTIIVYLHASGTGEQNQWISVLSLSRMHLRELWTHDIHSYQFVLGIPELEHWKTAYTLGFSDKGLGVEAVGIKTIYHPDREFDAKPDEIKHIRDIACWNTKQLKYLECGAQQARKLRSSWWYSPEQIYMKTKISSGSAPHPR